MEEVMEAAEGGMGSPGVVVSVGDLELEVEGLTINLKEEEGGGDADNKVKVKLLMECGSADRAKAKEEKSIQVLKIKNDPKLTKAQKLEMISKLEADRKEAVNRKTMNKRVTWRGQQLKEIVARVALRRRVEEEGWSPVAKLAEEDPNYKQFLSKVSPKWRETFTEERTRYLFYDVLSILPHWPTKTESSYMDTETLVGCRGVCHQWKDSVEKDLIQDFTRRQAWKLEPNDITTVAGRKFLPAAAPPRCPNKFQTVSKLLRFNYWSQHLYYGKNPLFSRKLSIGSGGDSVVEWRNNLTYWREMETLLRYWGREVWKVDIKLDNGMGPELVYEQICKLLKWMPNLRVLGLSAREVDKNSALMFIGNMMQERDPYAILKHRMEQNPLPELPHLKDIVVDDSLPPPLIQSALSKYGGMMVSISWHGPDADPAEFISGRRFPALKELVSVCNFPNSPNFQAGEFNLECPSLEQLSLHYGCSDDEGVAGFRKIIQSVNKSVPGLKWLALMTNFTKEVCLPDDLSLELPLLETLFLSTPRLNLKNIDFMLPCANLKELHMIYHKYIPLIGNKGARFSRPTKEEVIQFWDYTERLYESNIWKLFPELKKVSISSYTILKKPNGRGYEFGTRKQGAMKGKFWLEDDRYDNPSLDYTRKGYQEYCRNRLLHHVEKGKRK